MKRQYELPEPAYGFLPDQVILTALSAEQFARLMEHAVAFACLDGNASGYELVTQYLPEAYANLWMNSSLKDLPLLYPSDAGEAAFAGMSPTHPQYAQMTPARRAELRTFFKVNPDGNPHYMTAIIDKAEAVLGSAEAAADWVDHYSETLGGTPRELSNTVHGTNDVLRHLAGISHHGGVDG